MDVMELRRGLMMGMGSGINFSTETITIPQNSATLGHQTAEIIIRAISKKPIAIMSIDLVEAPSAENQFLRYIYSQQSYKVGAERYKNGTSNTALWNDAGYSSVVIEGTHYTVVYIV